MCAAPHTSNWDFLWFIVLATNLRIKVRWLAKHTLFVGMQGWFLRRLGGVPVRRHTSEDRVSLTADQFSSGKELVLLVPPEGTRALTERWKSGFYHIARAAHVPVVPVALNYGTRIAVIGDPVSAQLEIPAFMDQMRSFYADSSALYPEKFGPIRLAAEDQTKL